MVSESYIILIYFLFSWLIVKFHSTFVNTHQHHHDHRQCHKTSSRREFKNSNHNEFELLSCMCVFVLTIFLCFVYFFSFFANSKLRSLEDFGPFTHILCNRIVSNFMTASQDYYYYYY